MHTVAPTLVVGSDMGHLGWLSPRGHLGPRQRARGKALVLLIPSTGLINKRK